MTKEKIFEIVSNSIHCVDGYSDRMLTKKSIAHELKTTDLDAMYKEYRRRLDYNKNLEKTITKIQNFVYAYFRSSLDTITEEDVNKYASQIAANLVNRQYALHEHYWELAGTEN